MDYMSKLPRTPFILSTFFFGFFFFVRMCYDVRLTDIWIDRATDLPNIIAFLKVATPAALMFWLEEMAFNGMTFLAGYLHSTDATVANAIGINVLALSFTIPVCLSGQRGVGYDKALTRVSVDRVWFSGFGSDWSSSRRG
jgi:hypothetical protein